MFGMRMLLTELRVAYLFLVQIGGLEDPISLALTDGMQMSGLAVGAGPLGFLLVPPSQITPQ